MNITNLRVLNSSLDEAGAQAAFAIAFPLMDQQKSLNFLFSYDGKAFMFRAMPDQQKYDVYHCAISDAGMQTSASADISHADPEQASDAQPA